jgi:hypothetical protein
MRVRSSTFQTRKVGFFEKRGSGLKVLGAMGDVLETFIYSSERVIDDSSRD